MAAVTLERLQGVELESTRLVVRPRRMAPINGDKCFFWRTTGCLYDYPDHPDHPEHPDYPEHPDHHAPSGYDRWRKRKNRIMKMKIEEEEEGLYLQVKVTPATEAGKRTMTCITTCTLADNPTYIWYKNGHKVKEDTSSLYSDSFSDADSYSCAVKGHEDLHSPAVCQKCWSVTYTHQSICALKGSSVEMSCSYTYPSYHEIKTAFWFTKWESGMEAEDLSSVPGYEGHIEYLGDKKNACTLRITDLRLSDSAGYRFRFITSGGKFAGSLVSLTVTGNLSYISHL
ncbi:uncharacterized protein [Salvelinus sp. IW2-2015]|uniref:uncharacterized protein n=1 Tax=Salvelinus sp. IW2-2015 TaxID=2691554 RepID=UPI0038D3A2A9